MSKIALSGPASGTATYTISAPTGATDRTITLPDNTGTLVSTGSTAGVSQAMLASGVAGNGPAFSAYLSGNQSVTSSVFTKVQCNTEEFDTNSNYDNSTNYRFQPTVAGYYQINGSIAFSAGISKVEFLTSIFKNGAEFKRGGYINVNTVNNECCNVSALVYLNGSTDYVELYGYLSGTGSPNFAGSSVYNTYFQGFLARAA